MLNAMMHVIVTEGLVDQASSPAAPSATTSCAKNVEGYSPS
jgi:hypothetical protein